MLRDMLDMRQRRRRIKGEMGEKEQGQGEKKEREEKWGRLKKGEVRGRKKCPLVKCFRLMLFSYFFSSSPHLLHSSSIFCSFCDRTVNALFFRFRTVFLL